jgi:hypothetical protein
VKEVFPKRDVANAQVTANKTLAKYLAIWRDDADADAVRELVLKHPQLLHEHATIRDSNCGPPMT